MDDRDDSDFIPNQNEMDGDVVHVERSAILLKRTNIGLRLKIKPSNIVWHNRALLISDDFR